MCLKFPQPQTIQGIDELPYLLEQIKINLASYHLLTKFHCSEWVPSEWESKKVIKKHHNKPQVIHLTTVHKFTSCEVQSCVFAIKKSIIKAV